MGLSVNDIVKIGNLKFDLQTEVKGNKIVGEIFSQGRLLKKVEKNIKEKNISPKDIFEFHNDLKENLIQTILKKTKAKEVKRTSIDYLQLREKLSSILEIDKENIKLFSCQSPDFHTNTFFDEKYRNLQIEKIVANLKEKAKEISLLHKFFSSKNYLYFFFVFEGRYHLLILIHKDDTSIITLISNPKLGIVRRKFKDVNKLLIKLFEEKDNGTY